MKILVTGKSGQLGQSIKRILYEKYIANLSPLSFIFTSREELDFENLESIQSYFSINNIDVIINCAAYTKVDQAEKEKDRANLINHKAVRELAKISKKYKIKLIHISTDFVFNGHKKEPYTEDDETSPINIYGKTKLLGELAIISTMPCNSIIIRTGWIYSEFGNNFLKTILDLTTKRKKLDIVSDQIGTPTYAYDLAQLILHIVSANNFLENEKPTAIFHYSNKGNSSWYEFAKEIISISGINCQINPIKTEDYPMPAKRPKYSVLRKKKILQEYDLNIAHWKDALKACLQNL